MNDKILADFVRATAVPVVVTCAHGEIAWANAAFERSAGRSMTELRGRRLAEVAAAPVTLGSVWVFDDEGAAQQVTLLAEPAAPQAAEHRAFQATAANQVGVYEIALASDDVTWDDAMYRLYNVARSEGPLVGRRWLERIHPADRARTARLANEIRATSAQRFTHDFRLVCEGGAIKYIRSLGQVVRREDGSEAMLGINIDVSDTVTAEHARAEREAAERANLSKSEFLSRMSHELRTPLNGVRGFAQLLALNPAGLSAQQLEWLQQLNLSAERLLGLVDDMLELAPLECGAPQLRTERLALQPVLESAVQQVQALAAGYGVSVQLAALAQPVGVRADRARLQQVARQLLTNGIQYNRAGGRVGLSFEQQGRRVHFTVSDDGPGMEPQRLDQAFEPFNRMGAEASPVAGVGLGLAISRRLVEAMGGRISVASQPGQGTMVTVDLPSCDVSRLEASAPGDLTSL